MKKEQLKEAVGELNLVDTVFESDGVSYIDTAVSVMQVYDLIEQLDEPEKVVIPQFVAEWIEECQKRGLGLGQALDYGNLDIMPHEMKEYIKFNFSKLGCGHDKQDLVARAWLDGYKVEKEKLYYVLDKQCKTLLGIVNGKVSLWGGYELHDGNKRIHQLTEKQIKDYDERYWPFAVEVTE